LVDCEITARSATCIKPADAVRAAGRFLAAVFFFRRLAMVCSLEN
jgi:hypothetical protein